MTIRQADMDKLRQMNKKLKDDLSKVMPQIEALNLVAYDDAAILRKIKCRYASGVEESLKYDSTLRQNYLQDANESFLECKQSIKELSQKDIQKSLKKEIRDKEIGIQRNTQEIEERKAAIVELKAQLKANEKIILKFPKDFFKNTPDQMDDSC
jgi:hypothetical protein